MDGDKQKHSQPVTGIVLIKNYTQAQIRIKNVR